MATAENLDQKKKIYEERVRAELDKLNAQIAELRAKGDQVKADARIQYTNLLEELQVKQSAAERKLSEMQSSSEDAWADLQRGFEKAWSDLQTAFDSAASKVNGTSR